MVVEDYVDRGMVHRCARCEKAIAKGERHYGDPASTPPDDPYDIWCEKCNSRPPMPAKDDGGPAFPVGVKDEDDGMSLRDWFAGKATDEDVTASQRSPETGSNVAYSRTTARYRHADAMLAERAKGENG